MIQLTLRMTLVPIRGRNTIAHDAQKIAIATITRPSALLRHPLMILARKEEATLKIARHIIEVAHAGSLWGQRGWQWRRWFPGAGRLATVVASSCVWARTVLNTDAVFHAGIVIDAKEFDLPCLASSSLLSNIATQHRATIITALVVKGLALAWFTRGGHVCWRRLDAAVCTASAAGAVFDADAAFGADELGLVSLSVDVAGEEAVVLPGADLVVQLAAWGVVGTGQVV